MKRLDSIQIRQPWIKNLHLYSYSESVPRPQQIWKNMFKLHSVLSDVDRGSFPIITGPQNDATEPQKQTHFLNSLQFNISPKQLTTGSYFPKTPKTSNQDLSTLRLPTMYSVLM